MQSRNFRLQKVGDINWLNKNYQFQKISFSLDEIIILNASRTKKDTIAFSKVASLLAQNVFIPVAMGGGIKSIEDAEILFNSGADKIVLNSAFYENPALVSELVSKYGSQAVVASVDYRKAEKKEEVLINNGSEKIDVSLTDYLKQIENSHAGEIYLNSINQDGTGFGYDLDTLSRVQNSIGIPLIVAGGAGNEKHLLDALRIEQVSAAATANLFNFVGDGLPNAREKIINDGINLAVWKNERN